MSKTQQIAELLRHDLLEQGVKQGDAVPSMREVSKRYSVSLMTADRVLDELVSSGFLYRIPYHGAFIKEEPCRQICLGLAADWPQDLSELDVLKATALGRMNDYFTSEQLIPRRLSYLDLCHSSRCLEGLDGLLVPKSMIDDVTMPLLQRFEGRLMICQGVKAYENLCCSMVLPDWESAFRDISRHVDLSRFQRVVLIGATHQRARYLMELGRRYLERQGRKDLVIDSVSLEARFFTAEERAFRHFSERSGEYSSDDLLICFSDFLSLGIWRVFSGAVRRPCLVSFDNSEAYGESSCGHPVLTSVDWRLPDLFVESARQLVRMIREDDQCTYIVKLPCHVVVRESSALH